MLGTSASPLYGSDKAKKNTATTTQDLPASSASPSFHHKGGTLNTRILQWPSTFNIHTTNDAYSHIIGYFVSASLMTHSVEDWSLVPYIAEKWEVSKDHKTFNFTLNPRATFGFGKPVTVEDVKFTFDLIYDEKRCIRCANTRGYVGKLASVTITGPRTIAITTETVHFYSLNKIATVPILEKALYSKGNFDQDYSKSIHGAGPYLFDEKATETKKQVVLRRRKDFWLNNHPYFYKRHNFDTIVFKHIYDNTAAFEHFKRGELDYFYFDYNSYKYWDDRSDKVFQNPDVVRFQAPLTYPYTYHFISFNLREGSRAAELNIRKAINHLVNRPLIEKKIFHNHQAAVKGPFIPGPFSANIAVPSYDPGLASEYLKKAGFTEVGDDGILVRRGKNGEKERASYSLVHTEDPYVPWMNIITQDAKKVGLELNVRKIDWSELSTKIDDFSIEIGAFGLLGDVVPLPRGGWHSEGAMKSGSSNYEGFANAEVDALIEKLGVTLDEKARIPLYHEIEKKILAQVPRVFLWAPKNHYIAYWRSRINPTSKPMYPFNGDNLADPPFSHWISAEKRK